MGKISRNFRYLLGLPKTVYANFRLCSFRDAIRLPIIVSHKTKLENLSGKITFTRPKTAGIRVGFGSVETYDFWYQRTILSIPGHIHFKGKSKIGAGSRLSVSGYMEVGDNFHVSAASKIIVRKKLTLGSEVLIAWECILTDADHHHLLDKHNNIINPPAEIIVGNNVWIGARSMVLKGTQILDGSVVAAQSLVSGVFLENHVLIAGNPAKPIKHNIRWRE